VPFDIVFSGHPPLNRDNPAVGSYAVLAEANCGQGVLPKISCGTLKVVNPASCSGGDNTSTHYCSGGTRKEYVILTDTRDNKTYKAVVIGTQTWMAENLNYAPSSGTSISCDKYDCATYGRLYDWAMAMGFSPYQNCNQNNCSQMQVPRSGICPNGWHLPSKTEWEIMTTYIGGADTKLKATSGWPSYEEFNGNGTNDYGFSALPGGFGGSDGSFFGNVGNDGYWWSASESSSSHAYYRDMHYDDYAYWYNYSKDFLFSVRCLQD
jgi:uncharacterized protein (TIGR02145 family)